MTGSTSSLHSLASQSSLGSSPRVDSTVAGDSAVDTDRATQGSKLGDGNDAGILAQVALWLREEKAKQKSRRSVRKAGRKAKSKFSARHGKVEDGPSGGVRVDDSSSESSAGDLALEQLEKILAQNLDRSLSGLSLQSASGVEAHGRPSQGPRRRSSAYLGMRRPSTTASSDTEYHDGDALVPSCDVDLDNSKTLGYSGGGADSNDEVDASQKRNPKDQQAWATFKREIVRLAHTLKLKGWRSIPLDRGDEIEIERLSGALTNAVYVVSPPKNVRTVSRDGEDATKSATPKRTPQKLLLRIYGPQVEHLIDREKELQILRRLARKKIGPRLLGTFSNGRFEEFFNATTLKAEDLRNPATSQHIAKRMRELHDGIELLEEERDAGPFVWRNWDKWVERCGQVISWVDQQILEGPKAKGCQTKGLNAWKKRGLVCGVEWRFFRRAVEKYRQWLEDQSGGAAGLRQQLVFAHNDTQYGNILRLKPSGESPLLIPANQHKQLVVIDFEYASANVPGLEFANHFTEWCYNYHDAEKPYALHASKYPTLEEQRRFIQAYVEHRPSRPQRPSLTTASMSAGARRSNSISSFMLDSRIPPAQVSEDEDRRDKATTDEVNRLVIESKLWRVANSAQWVAWGVVQANIPGMSEDHSDNVDQAEGSTSGTANGKSHGDANEETDKSEDTKPAAGGEEGEEEEDFDYLGYAQERAMLFWADLISLGLVSLNELPSEYHSRLKFVEHTASK
ncbi:MAG: hypothetical protein M1825_000229 [Sarcosagium campestre]|nr:MAG: hypothetical protein M1825_000229 [Sarcosagium campestre]